MLVGVLFVFLHSFEGILAWPSPVECLKGRILVQTAIFTHFMYLIPQSAFGFLLGLHFLPFMYCWCFRISRIRFQILRFCGSHRLCKVNVDILLDLFFKNIHLG